MQAIDRPLPGYAPAEVSGLNNLWVIDAHVSEAGFLWTQRDCAVHAPHFRLEHLARIDRRLEGHLEGIKCGGATSCQSARQGLEAGDAAAAFAQAYAIGCTGRFEDLQPVLDLAASSPEFERATVAAMAWLDEDLALGVLVSLSQAATAATRRLALAVWAARRTDAGTALTRDVQSEDSLLCARAARAAGVLKRHDLAPALRALLRDTRAECRRAGAISLALLGDAAGVEWLAGSMLEGQCRSQPEIEVAVRNADPAEARAWIRSLAGSRTTLRSAILAAGALGDTAAIPWLVEHMSDPEHARVAGEAFSTITGADLEWLDLRHESPGEDDDSPVSMDDADLPWPDPDRVADWWRREGRAFGADHRRLAGQPITREGMLAVLRQGYQRQRQAAAFELARLQRDTALFPIAAPASRQAAWLAT